MSTRSGGAVVPRYEIVLHGTLGDDAQAALLGSSCHCAAGRTIVTGTMVDQDDLARALEVFASLGLGLHSFRLLPEVTPDQAPEDLAPGSHEGPVQRPWGSTTRFG